MQRQNHSSGKRTEAAPIIKTAFYASQKGWYETTRNISNGNRVEQGKPLRGICLNEPDSAKCRIFIVKTFKRMKHYKLQTGGNRNIFDVLTIDDNGRMTLTFHGTDRAITHEATANDDGWIAAGSSLYPPLSCGRWTEIPDDAKGTGKRENETAKGTRKRENETEKRTRKRENEGQIPDDANGTRKRENETAKRTRERENEGQKERNIYANLYGDYFQEAQQKEKENQKHMIFAGIATVVVFIILVNFIGIFGLAALGLMAGGIVK